MNVRSQSILCTGNLVRIRFPDLHTFVSALNTRLEKIMYIQQKLETSKDTFERYQITRP